MARMTDPNLTPQQQYQEMMRLTRGLNVSDQGSLTEDWVRLLHVQGQSQTQVPVGRSSLQAQGITGLEGDRKIDILSGSTLYEVKSGGGAMNKHDLEQFEDFMRLTRGQGQVTRNGQNFTVESAQYVFTNPEGVRANARWMQNQFLLDGNDNLSFRVFNRSGESKVIDFSNFRQEIQNLNAWSNQ
jgi:hypothetical protein